MARNVSDIIGMRKSSTIEDRRNNLQRYLSDLSLIPLIRESTAFRQFIGMEEQCPEEYETAVALSGSYFIQKSEDEGLFTTENISPEKCDPLSPEQPLIEEI